MTKNGLTHNGLIHLIYLILETKFGGNHSTHLSPDPSKKNHAAKKQWHHAAKNNGTTFHFKPFCECLFANNFSNVIKVMKIMQRGGAIRTMFHIYYGAFLQK